MVRGKVAQRVDRGMASGGL